MREFAYKQTLILLRRFSIQVGRASRGGDAEAIHDLRVSIRRLSRCLRLFAEFYPGRSKKLRRQLKELLDACARVRDRDVTLEILATAGFSANSVVVRRLRRDRAVALAKLMTLLSRWKELGVLRRARFPLGI